LLKDVRHAIARGSLTEQGFAIAESFHLLEEASKSGIHVEAVIAAERGADRVTDQSKVFVVEDRLFDRIASTETSQGVIALVRLPQWSFDDCLREPSLLVAIDAVQDPGNCGAIVRSAEAFGATGVVMLKGSANAHNPKTLRASAGSLFRVPFVAGVSTEELLSRTGAIRRFTADPRSQTPLEQADLTGSCAVIIGSEGRGVHPSLLASSLGVRISTEGVESLNAAVAAGVILYEAQRQRRSRLGPV
jgi:TrmH family RNA methyltransferase